MIHVGLVNAGKGYPTELNYDFFQLYKNQLFYYWHDTYELNEHHYDNAASEYLFELKEIKKGIRTELGIQRLIKLKLIAKHTGEWDFPIVLHNNGVRNGTGRVFVDHFILHRANQKTILISDTPLDGEQLFSIHDLEKHLPFDFSVYVEDGLILSFEPNRWAFREKLEYLYRLNTQAVVEEVLDLPACDLPNLLQFINSGLRNSVD